MQRWWVFRFISSSYSIFVHEEWFWKKNILHQLFWWCKNHSMTLLIWELWASSKWSRILSRNKLLSIPTSKSCNFNQENQRRRKSDWLYSLNYYRVGLSIELYPRSLFIHLSVILTAALSTTSTAVIPAVSFVEALAMSLGMSSAVSYSVLAAAPSAAPNTACYEGFAHWWSVSWAVAACTCTCRRSFRCGHRKRATFE